MKKDKTAFPSVTYNEQGVGTHNPGMTLRDYFAAAAMQGVIAAGKQFSPEGVYNVADAMLKAREKELSKN